MKNFEENTEYKFKLFVAGSEPNSLLATKVVTEVCESWLKNNSSLEIIDVYENYQQAIDNKILVVPTLFVESLQGNYRIVGSLNTSINLTKSLGISFKDHDDE